MVVSTSYFYNVRFLNPCQLPVSTACWDPKWFYAGKKQGYRFFDKHGVLNGVRAEFLHPDQTCQHLCRGPEFCASKDPANCLFLERYKAQLLRLGRSKIMMMLEKIAAAFQNVLGIAQLPDVVLLVHEPPYKACSERKVLQEVLGIEELDVKKQLS